jgi:hypothetical protein
MATDTLYECSLPVAFPAPTRVDDDGWRGIAELHSLKSLEIELLMSCRVVRVCETSAVQLIACKLRESYVNNDTDRLQNILCILVRAEIGDGVETRALESVTLGIALRCEDGVGVGVVMASCVRLARLLACKLDAVNGLHKIYDTMHFTE